MRILHLTDYHFRNSEKVIPDQNKLVDALIKSLKSEGKIDFLFFSGDLVFSGKIYEDFLLVKESLLRRIVKELKIDTKNTFICGGNHDVSRNQELEDITESISRVSSSSALEEYIRKQDGRSFEGSLANLKNYIKFQKEFYEEFGNHEDIIKNLYTVHRREFERKRIGVVTINTGWRSIDSKTDRGNLLFPVETVN